MLRLYPGCWQQMGVHVTMLSPVASYKDHAEASLLHGQLPSFSNSSTRGCRAGQALLAAEAHAKGDWLRLERHRPSLQQAVGSGTPLSAACGAISAQRRHNV